ncbi:hypothetical protein QYF36_003064 [Acer negundo]|nr:hypothetical protein QYF36_003064 [Acer negundo]
MKELRVKGTYLHHKEIKAAQGIKIAAQGLEHAIAGTGLYVVGIDDDLEDVKEAAMEDMKSVMSRIDKSGEGFYVQASTLGSLEAFLEYLKSLDVCIPVSGIGIGSVHKKDVMKASVIMLEKKKEYGTILAFDVKVTLEAQELAAELGVGTPICIPQRDFIDIGRIASIENNRKPVEIAKKGQKVSIKVANFVIYNLDMNHDEQFCIFKNGCRYCITPWVIVSSGASTVFDISYISAFADSWQQKMFGRHFDVEDELVSHISRRSIDVLKDYYPDDLSPCRDECKLVVKLKNLFKIQ